MRVPKTGLVARAGIWIIWIMFSTGVIRESEKPFSHDSN